jgi:predicted MPP superfamily phosphohydrolase
LVKPNDYLFYLGDWCLNTSAEEFENDLTQINCRNILMIWGNHNSQIKSVYEREVRKVAYNINGSIDSDNANKIYDLIRKQFTDGDAAINQIKVSFSQNMTIAQPEVAPVPAAVPAKTPAKAPVKTPVAPKVKK